MKGSIPFCYRDCVLQKAKQGWKQAQSFSIGHLAIEGRQQEVKNFNPLRPLGTSILLWRHSVFWNKSTLYLEEC